MYEIRNKIVSKFVEKLITCMIMFKDILTFLDLIIEVIRIFFFYESVSKNQINRIIIMHKNLLLKKVKINMFKMDVRTFW